MKKCLNCKKDVIAKENKFCSRSCSAIFNNAIRNKIVMPSCKECGKAVKKSNASFCSQKCFGLNKIARNERSLNSCGACDKKVAKNRKYCSVDCAGNGRSQSKIEEWRKGMEVKISNFSLRTLLRKEDGCSCSKCGNTQWNGIPIHLEVEHIDGNSANNVRGNVCLLCPNCHAQTPTYKSKNIGNGRHSRRTRYKEGKSF